MNNTETLKLGSLHPVVLRVGEYYIRRSPRGIPRVVKLRTITADGRYCQVSYSCCGTKLHACRADELEAENDRSSATREEADGSK